MEPNRTETATSDAPVLRKDGGVAVVDDKAAKLVGIDRFIGQRPLFTAGILTATSRCYVAAGASG